VRGTTYCFRAVAKDKAGNTGLPSSQTCTARLVDDPALAHSTGWRTLRSTAYDGGSASKTARKGKSLALGSFHGRRLALRAITCPTCGSVNVYVGTTLVKRVSLVSTTKRTVLITIPLASAMTGKVRIVTRSARTVIVDGLGVSHL
jgi:hypothetical protein